MKKHILFIILLLPLSYLNAQVDLAIISSNLPKNGCNLSVSETVEITLTNKGSQIAIGFNAGFILNGNTVNENFTQVINVGDTITVTITQGANLSALHFSEIKLFVDQNNDVQANNDSLNFKLYNGDKEVLLDQSFGNVKNFNFLDDFNSLVLNEFNDTIYYIKNYTFYKQNQLTMIYDTICLVDENNYTLLHTDTNKNGWGLDDFFSAQYICKQSYRSNAYDSFWKPTDTISRLEIPFSLKFDENDFKANWFWNGGHPTDTSPNSIIEIAFFNVFRMDSIYISTGQIITDSSFFSLDIDHVALGAGFHTFWAEGVFGDCRHRDSITIEIKSTTIGVEEQQLFNKIKVGPNPANTFVNINLPKALQGQQLKLKLYNMQGKLVQLKNTKAAQPKLNFNELPKGIYLLQISNAVSHYNVKIFIE